MVFGLHGKRSRRSESCAGYLPRSSSEKSKGDHHDSHQSFGGQGSGSKYQNGCCTLYSLWYQAADDDHSHVSADSGNHAFSLSLRYPLNPQNGASNKSHYNLAWMCYLRTCADGEFLSCHVSSFNGGIICGLSTARGVLVHHLL